MALLASSICFEQCTLPCTKPFTTAERANWLGVDPEEDEFAKGMMAAGVSKETMAAWSSDPQATCSGETGSLFDFSEDLDADDCLAKCRTIQ